jgi:hypothetical protein
MKREERERSEIHLEKRYLTDWKFKIKCFAPNIWIVIRHLCPCPLVLNKVK